MRKYIDNIVEKVKTIDSALEEIHKQSIIQRGRGLKKAVEDGWYVPFLRGAEIAGLTAANIGLYTSIPTLTGIGAGFAGMAGLHDILIWNIQRKK